VDDDTYPNISWKTPVSSILGEDFVLADSLYTENITIEDILSHRTGLPGHDESYLGSNSERQDTAKSITRNLRNLPISKPLRTDYQYCNMMFTVATHIIETVTGHTYSEFIKTRLWEPLGMSNTYLDVPDVEAADAMGRMATGYRWDTEKGHVGVPSYAQPEAQGAGCVFSSVADWAKWVRAMLHRSEPLSKSGHEELVKPRTIIHLEKDEEIPFCSQPLYALGWQVESYRGHTLIGHDGSFSGFRASIRFLPGHDWGFVVFGNSNSAYYASQMVLHLLMDDKLNIPINDCTDWPGFWKALYEKDQSEEEDEKLKSLSLLSVQGSDMRLEKLAGSYYNAGYHTLDLEFRDGTLEADCKDRCMPFKLTFFPSEGQKFDVRLKYTLDGYVKTLKADTKLDDHGEVTSFGIGFVEEIEDHLVWFDKVV
jgi:CubicO group peptidase (beta-lactamase class C family)